MWCMKRVLWGVGASSCYSSFISTYTESHLKWELRHYSYIFVECCFKPHGIVFYAVEWRDQLHN